MKRYLGHFNREKDLLQAAEQIRQEGVIVDIYTPYPIHGTARALGLARSRLPCAAFVFGLLGLTLAFWFQFWASAWDWPINVGGRPWNSLPAFVPVAFEMMVLFAGLGLVLTWLLVCRLFPGKKACLPSPRVTDDGFVLEVQVSGSQVNPEAVRKVFQEYHALQIEEREET